MKIPIQINSTSGQQELGVKPRTGVIYCYVSSVSGYDTGILFQNNTATASTITYALYDSTGTQIKSTVNNLYNQTTAVVDANGGNLAVVLSTIFPNKTGIFVGWLSSGWDDGSQNDLSAIIDLVPGAPSTDGLLYYALYPPDLRNVYANHPCKQQIYTTNPTNITTASIFINPNLQLTCVDPLIGGGSSSAITGTNNYKNILSTGITGYWYQDNTHNGAITSADSTLFDNVLFSSILVSSSSVTSPFTMGRTPVGFTTTYIINSINELDIMTYVFSLITFDGGITIVPRFYT